jgi:hypothetical protein
MARKKTVKKEKPGAGKPQEEPQAKPKAGMPAKAPEAPKPSGKPPAEGFETIDTVSMPAEEAAKPEGAGSMLKTGAVLLLLFAVVLLAYYYFVVMPGNSFAPGSEVDADTFKGIFANADNLYIVMDVRDAPDDATSTAILQCGVDFAASNGTGGKTVTPISLSKDGCVAPDGMHPTKDCFALLPGGLTIYVKEGSGGVKYYSNGMVVRVSSNYTVGTCGIKRV